MWDVGCGTWDVVVRSMVCGMSVPKEKSITREDL